MKINDIRTTFLNFFKEKGHQIVPSAPIVVKNDPTLLFTNAGMNQFKDWFLGNEKPQYKRVVDTQKCLRVSGKHNDLEEVGFDTYHHTMFEMIGNWSFGDYFKKEAIEWAWELLTEVYKLPKDILYVSVFEGSAEDGLGFDQETYDLWKQFVKEDHILKGSKKDNFWEMGDTGPCGPCTEIHIDLRSEQEKQKIKGSELVNNDHPQVVEIWNNVFMEFNRKADGSLEKLPEQHVDTGMGLERLAMALQHKTSNYDTDVFQPLIEHLKKLSNLNYSFTQPNTVKALTEVEKIDIAMRVIADHVRAITFAIADGQMPSNNKAGYVIRRILRRAVRYGYSFLNFTTSNIYHLVDTLCIEMGAAFPEIIAQKEFIKNTIKEEEEAFLRTLSNGIVKLEQYCSDSQSKTVKGSVAFELFDTFGFPLDLTALIAKEKGFTLDLEGFNKAMAIQVQNSQKAAQVEKTDWIELTTVDNIEFVGYDAFKQACSIVKYRKITEKNKNYFQLVLDKTPLYAESGGQVGDNGKLIGTDNEIIEIQNTIKENNLIIHIVKHLPQNLKQKFEAQVNIERRNAISKNHSATHLLHAALHQVIGKHATQKGSLVNDTYFRFDFTALNEITPIQLNEIEQIVNQKITDNIVLKELRNVTMKNALNLGAMALFGEKYGDNVRVIIFDEKYSVELCGGTHIANTSQIGLFKIINQSSVGTGIRRIEAMTGLAALNYFNEKLTILDTVKEILKVNKDDLIVKQVQKNLDDKKELELNLQNLNKAEAKKIKELLKTKVQQKGSINLIAEIIDFEDADQVKSLLFELRNELPNVLIALGQIIKDKPFISVIIGTDLDHKTHNATQYIKKMAQYIKGGGGGQPFYATAGGNNINGLKEAIKVIENELI